MLRPHTVKKKEVPLCVRSSFVVVSTFETSILLQRFLANKDVSYMS